MALGAMVPAKVRGPLESVGGMYTIGAEAVYWIVKDSIKLKFQLREFLERCWFLVSVTILPSMLVSVPLGVAIGLQVGALAAQVGATSFLGAANAIAVLRQAAPLITALILAGVGGSAICAELGSRTIREEIDAMEVLGINPIQRLVAPLMAAGVVVAGLMNMIVIFVAVTSGYGFSLTVLHGTKGSFIASFTQFASTTDFWATELKAMAFGAVTVVIAAYKGLTAKKGPTGVGEAVNQSVVLTGIALGFLNVAMTQLYFALVDVRTF